VRRLAAAFQNSPISDDFATSASLLALSESSASQKICAISRAGGTPWNCFADSPATRIRASAAQGRG